MTRVIASNSRLLKFKITESMLSMITVWNDVTQILLFYAAEQTMNLSVYIFKANHIQNYTTLNKK